MNLMKLATLDGSDPLPLRLGPLTDASAEKRKPKPKPAPKPYRVAGEVMCGADGLFFTDDGWRLGDNPKATAIAEDSIPDGVYEVEGVTASGKYFAGRFSRRLGGKWCIVTYREDAANWEAPTPYTITGWKRVDD